MGSDAESEPKSIPKLPLFSIPVPPHLHEPSGTLTPPLQTSASVPFRWEEQPGKPRPCTDLILHTTPSNKCLDLPPRLASNIITKTPSPTTVLDGPGDKSVFSSSSFRFPTERRRRGQRQRSFDSSCSGGWSPNDDTSAGQQLLLGNKQLEQQNGSRGGLFGSFRLKGTHKAKSTGTGTGTGTGCVISSSSTDREDKNGKRLRRNSSLSKVTRSHFWAAIYEGFKHVVPWKKKAKKEAFTL